MFERKNSKLCAIWRIFSWLQQNKFPIWKIYLFLSQLTYLSWYQLPCENKTFRIKLSLEHRAKDKNFFNQFNWLDLVADTEDRLNPKKPGQPSPSKKQHPSGMLLITWLNWCFLTFWAFVVYRVLWTYRKISMPQKSGRKNIEQIFENIPKNSFENCLIYRQLKQISLTRKFQNLLDLAQGIRLLRE